MVKKFLFNSCAFLHIHRKLRLPAHNSKLTDVALDIFSCSS